jgi:hypothetical protein
MADLAIRISTLESQVSSLERLVQFLMQVNGLDMSALRQASEQDLLQHYQDATFLLAVPPSEIDTEVMKRWAELYIQITEYELTRLKHLVEYDHTWQPFFQGCIRMMTALRQMKEFSTNLDLQSIYGVLDRGRRNLREAAIILIQNAVSEPPPIAQILLKDGIDPLIPIIGPKSPKKRK